MGVPEYLGHPLLIGDDIAALAAFDLYFRWWPGQYGMLMRIHNPLPGLDLDVSPTARFGGYPPALSPAGVVAADDVTHRFMTVLDGFPHNRWHRDMSWSLGIPAVDREIIYTGAGGPGAVRGLMAIHSGTGIPVWTFAPTGLPPDPTRMVRTQIPKTGGYPRSSQARLWDPEGTAPSSTGYNGRWPWERPRARRA